MIEITFIQHDGKTRAIRTEPDRDLMSVARRADIQGILAECGGTAACGTCHVYIDPAWIEKMPQASDDEADMLSFSAHLRDESRLSCQIQLTPDLDGLVVNLPEQQG